MAVRPEFYWDRNGRMTGGEQFIQAITTTVEYRLPVGMHSLIARLEHRYDESGGPGGGFFKGGELAPGVMGLVSEQHLLFFSLIWAFDS